MHPKRRTIQRRGLGNPHTSMLRRDIPYNPPRTHKPINRREVHYPPPIPTRPRLLRDHDLRRGSRPIERPTRVHLHREVISLIRSFPDGSIGALRSLRGDAGVVDTDVQAGVLCDDVVYHGREVVGAGDVQVGEGGGAACFGDQVVGCDCGLGVVAGLAAAVADDDDGTFFGVSDGDGAANLFCRRM